MTSNADQLFLTSFKYFQPACRQAGQQRLWADELLIPHQRQAPNVVSNPTAITPPATSPSRVRWQKHYGSTFEIEDLLFMRLTIPTLIFTFFVSNVFAQLEVTTGYAVNKNLLDGLPIQIAYDIKVKERFYTKPQIGYKYLYHFNDFVGATLKVNILEFHQTLSYEVIKINKFILKPNIGLNYRFYYWKGEMKLPYDVLPQRVYKIEFRDDRLRLNSFAPTIPTDGNYTDQYSVNNIGFTIQLQSQFRINEKIWMHITPFLEPDYDRSQNTGGCYVGIILKQL